MNMITVTCPHCNQTLEADENLAGKTVNCPACGKTFVASGTNVIRLAPVGTCQPTKRKLPLVVKIVVPIIVLVVLLFVLGRLRVSWFQHPEEAEDPRVLSAEKGLVLNFIIQHGELRAEDFLRTEWDEETSRRYRSWTVPWAAFKSREARIEARISKMTSFFNKRVEEYFVLMQSVRENSRITWGTNREFINDEVEAVYREMAEQDNQQEMPTRAVW